MIQRIQSVYLLLTTLLSILFLNGNILSFINKSGTALRITFSGIVQDIQGVAPTLVDKVLPLSVLIIIVPVLALMAIFLYKNRIIQLRVVMILIVLEILLILTEGYYSYIVISKYEGTLSPGYKMVLPVILLILSVLAYRGIKKDELLVKSYDRLR